MRAVTCRSGCTGYLDRRAYGANPRRGAFNRARRLMNETWPRYEGYQAKTDREIPVVVLARV
jgi:hypothetical protein